MAAKKAKKKTTTRKKTVRKKKLPETPKFLKEEKFSDEGSAPKSQSNNVRPVKYVAVRKESYQYKNLKRLQKFLDTLFGITLNTLKGIFVLFVLLSVFHFITHLSIVGVSYHLVFPYLVLAFLVGCLIEDF